MLNSYPALCFSTVCWLWNHLIPRWVAAASAEVLRFAYSTNLKKFKQNWGRRIRITCFVWHNTLFQFGKYEQVQKNQFTDDSTRLQQSFLDETSAAASVGFSASVVDDISSGFSSVLTASPVHWRTYIWEPLTFMSLFDFFVGLELADAAISGWTDSAENQEFDVITVTNLFEESLTPCEKWTSMAVRTIGLVRFLRLLPVWCQFLGGKFHRFG